MYRKQHVVRRLLGGLGVLSLVASAFVVLGPIGVPAAEAASCSDTWLNTAGGDWTTAADWSSGMVPGSGDVACITTAGNYTVDISAGDGSQTVGGLVLGGTTGSQVLEIDAPSALTAYGTTSDGPGSTIDNQGTFTVPEVATFDQDAGSTTGSPISVAGDLDFTGTGSSSFSVISGYNSQVSGDIAADQSITLNGGDDLTFPGSAANAGTITLAGTSADNITVSSGTLTNTGTIDVESGNLASAFDGAFDNQGTGSAGIIADSSVTLNGTLTNEGSLSVGAGATFTDAGTLSNNSGSIANAGTLTVDYNETFDQGAGTTSGNPINVAGELNFTGAGQSSFDAAPNYSPYVTGNIAADQSINMMTSNTLYVTGPATNAGTITSTGTTNEINVSGGTLTNTGTIEAESGNTGPLYIYGTVDNQGTGGIVGDSSITLNGTLTNEGDISIALGTTFLNEGTLDNTTGTINNAGSLTNSEVTTVSEGSGPILGNPVDLNYDNLNLTGTGQASFVDTGGFALYVTGTLAPAQSLTLGTGTSVYGLSTNDGTIDSEGGSSGVTFAQALTNNGSLEVGSGGPTTIDGSYTQGSGGSLQFDIGDPVNYGHLNVGGTASVAGQLAAATQGFTPSVGSSFAVLTSSGLSGTFSSTAFGSQPYTTQYSADDLDLIAASGMVVTTSDLPDGQAGVAYTAPALTSSGGVAPITWQVTSGTLPSGLSLDSTTGVISGTPISSGSSTFTVTATDSSTPSSQTASAVLSISVTPSGLGVTTTSLPAGQVGVGYLSSALQSAGGTAPVTWSVSSGHLPRGLSLDTGTGMISGTPMAAGASTFGVTATDSSTPKAETAEGDLTIIVTAALSVSTTSLPAGQDGVVYPGATLASAGGTAPVTWAITSGSLPVGLSLDATTGAITGTPTGPGAVSSFTVSATDSGSPPATESAALSIAVTSPALQIIQNGSLPGGSVGIAYPATTLVSSGGTAPVTWAVSGGKLPAGLALGASSGTISGTPTSAGDATFTVSATDASTPKHLVAKVVLTIDVTASLNVTTTALPNAQVGSAYPGATLASTGGTAPVSWAITGGSLPSGLSLAAGTGTISGTPTGPGVVSLFSVTATDSSSPTQETATANLSIAVTSVPLNITTTSLPGGEVGSPYPGTTLTSTGGTSPVGWALIGGSLPAGLGLNDTSGAITGTPTSAGTSNFTVMATDSSASPLSAKVKLSITVAPALSVATTALPAGQVGTPYAAGLSASGGTPPVIWAVTTGKLPAGLALNGSSGVISGTPTVIGTTSFTVTATDSSTPTPLTAKAKLSIAVNGPTLSVTTTSLPGGSDGTAYPGATLASTGGTAPISWSVTSGSLPSGLSLDASTGAISGTPTGAGVVTTFTVTATDTSVPTPQTASANLSITITSPALTITTSSIPNGEDGETYVGATLASSGGTAPITWSVSKGKLPAGLSLNPSTGSISGTPTAGGTTFTLTATDSSAPTPLTAQTTLSLSVNAALSVTTSKLPGGQVGSPYSGATLASTGGTAPVTWMLASGSLPAGLGLNATTGAITGTPTVSGTSSFTAEALDSSTPDPQSVSATFSVTVSSVPLNVTTTTLPPARVGAVYPTTTLASTGGLAPILWSVSSGKLPTGLSLNTVSGQLTGTPTQAGSFPFGVTATDSTTPKPLTSTVTFTIVVTSPLAITTTSLPSGQVGAAYSGATLASTGGTAPVTWSVTSGSLPAGLSLVPATGSVTGTPTASGTTTFTVTATDSSSPIAQSVSTNLSVTVQPSLPRVGTQYYLETPVNQSFGVGLAAIGGQAPYTWSLAKGSKLPYGIVLNSTGSIRGDPVSVGTYVFSVEVTDALGHSATGVETFIFYS